jgi:VWFA-related protein
LFCGIPTIDATSNRNAQHGDYIKRTPADASVRLSGVNSLSRRVFIALTTGAVSAQTPKAPASEEPVATFSTGVSLVKVDAKVTRRNGSPVTDLKAADFIVYDEDAPRAVTHFASESDPIQLVLLLDVSASMLQSLSIVSEHAREALQVLRPGDQVGVILFATRSDVLQPLTTEWDAIPGKIGKSIYKETLGRSTFLNDGLITVAHHLEKQPAAGRRSVIVITDNDVGRGSSSDEEIVRALHAADTVMNAIIVSSEPVAPRSGARYTDPASAPPDVFRFAQATGGEVVAHADAAEALKRMLERVTTRYSLHYVAPPSERGAFRRIRVELSPSALRQYPDAVIQARSGYVAE